MLEDTIKAYSLGVAICKWFDVPYLDRDMLMEAEIEVTESSRESVTIEWGCNSLNFKIVGGTAYATLKTGSMTLVFEYIGGKWLLREVETKGI